MANKPLSHVGRDLGYESVIPIAGTYYRGDKLWNKFPWKGHPMGWVCVQTGAAGTWMPFGAIGNVGVDLWTPALLPSLQLWFAAYTIQQADNTPVITWADMSRNAWDLTQPSSTKRPTFRLAQTVLNSTGPTVVFDGVDDLLTTTASIIALRTDTNGAMIAVAKGTSASAGEAVASFSRSAQNYYLNAEARNAANFMQVGQRANDTADVVVGNTAVGSTWHVYVWGSDGAAFILELDGTAQTESATSGGNNGDWLDTVTSMDRFSLGGRSDTTSDKDHLTGEIAEFFYCNNWTEVNANLVNILRYIQRVHTNDLIYTEAGALKYRGLAGTVTTVAPT